MSQESKLEKSGAEKSDGPLGLRGAAFPDFADPGATPDAVEVTASDILAAAVLAPGAYDPSDLIDRVRALGVEDDALIDICIPTAAQALGQGWLDDDLTFTQVSAAASRLFALSKVLADGWTFENMEEPGMALLVVSFRREDHLLGPGLLAQQLRRRGHSVHVMSNADADMVAGELGRGEYEGLLVSASSLVSLDNAVKSLTRLRQTGYPDVPVIVGGRALEYSAARPDDIPADLVTSDIEAALAFIGSDGNERGNEVAR